MSSFGNGYGYSKLQRRTFLAGLSGGGGSGETFAPIAVSPSAAYNGTSGSGFTSTPAPSPTLRGSGHPFPAIIATTHIPRECAESDAYYFLLRGGGDPVLMGSCTIDFYYESDTPVTFTDANIQWDPNDGIFGVPVSPRPKSGLSGLHRWYAIVKPTNGYEYMITGEVWHNRPITTGYVDRDARAAYVCGADFNGSGAPGTTTTVAKGSIGTPNPNLAAAINFMFGANDGGYIYVKGLTDEGVNHGTARTGPFPCEVRPWPGFNKNQTMISKSTRIAGQAGGIVNFQHDYVVMNGVQVNPDQFTKMQARSSSLGFRACAFLGTVDGGLDAFGQPKGHIASVATANSQDFFTSDGGQFNWVKNCTFTGYCFTGCKVIVNTGVTLAWDSASFGRNLVGIYWWNFRVNQPGSGVARFHYEEDLTVATVGPLASGWTPITFSGSPTLINNLFETRVRVLTGTLAGNVYGAQGAGAGLYSAPLANQVACVASNTGTNYSSYPAPNTVYVALTDLATLGLAAGDKVRIYNVPHPDSWQFAQMSVNTDVPGQNMYCQKYLTYAASQQGMLVQPGLTTMTGTVTITGDQAVFSASITIPREGLFLSLNASSGFTAGTGLNKRYKYARILTSGTGTTFTLENTSLDGVVGHSYRISHTVVGVLFENCIFNKYGTDDELIQWQHGAAGWHIHYSTFLGQDSSNTRNWMFRTDSAGFGLAGITLRKNVISFMGNDALGGFPAAGITLDRNHYIAGTLQGSNTSTGNPSFDATGSFTSGYKPTANVQTDPAPAIKYDVWGNLRAVGSRVGAVA